MLGFPAAAVAGKSCLAQKQTLVAKKQTLELNQLILTPGSAFLPSGSVFMLRNFFLQLLQKENQALFCKNIFHKNTQLLIPY